MVWVYQVQEVKTHKGTGETYVLVQLWPDRADFAALKPPHGVHTFIMQLRLTGQRAVTDAEGRTLRQSGVWASESAPPDDNDPAVTETFPIDVVAQIKGNIERFLEVNTRDTLYQPKMKVGNIDPNDPSIKTDTSDPKGILAKPEVAALAGKDFDGPTIGVRRGRNS